MDNKNNPECCSQKDYIQNILQFIPVTVLHHLADKTDEERAVLPQCQTFTTAVLVAEIKKFYDQAPLIGPIINKQTSHGAATAAKSSTYAESYFKSEQIFNESLGQQSNRFLDIMTKTIHKYGGDIVQFLGNSLVAVWPRKLFNPDEILDEKLRKDRIEEDSNIMVGRKAVQCALEIKIESLKYFFGQNQIFMGVGFGDCGLMHVGGVFGRIEHLLIGRGQTSALKALKYATIEQPVVVSQTLWQIVDKFFVWKQLAMNSHLPERSVEYVFGMPVKSSFNTVSLRDNIHEYTLKDLHKELKGFIPASYRQYLKLKKDHYGCEHRRITMLIVNVEMEYNLAAPSSFQIIQKIVKIIQQQVYRMEGSFTKIISYEGGFTVMCSWGLSPMSHTDDAARAVLAAINMQKKLIYFFQVVAGMPDFSPPVHFGICTGNIFMGIVGNGSPLVSRKEIVILGETIERTFLFMQTATKVFGRIFVDYATKAEATHDIDFQYLEHIQFADKFLNYAVFAPIDPITDYESPFSQLKPSTLLKQIRLHSNPFKLDLDSTYQHTNAQLYGSIDVLGEIAKDIADYANSTEDSVWALAIKGQPGSGKSLFARRLLIEVIKNQTKILAERNRQMLEQAQYKYFAKNMTFEFVVSSCNAEFAKRFLGAWVPVLRIMLEVLSVSTKVKHAVILNKILSQSTAADKVDIVEEIFGLSQNFLDHTFAPQILLKNQPNAFVVVKSYPKPVEDSLIEFLTDFIKEAINQLREELIFFIIFDNVSLMDASSWALFESVTGVCDHLIIVSCIQTQTHSFGNDLNIASSDNFAISDHAQRFYMEKIKPQESNIFHLLDLDPISEVDLRQIIIDLGEDYVDQMMKEVDLMTAIIDPLLNQVKTGESQNDLKRRLVQMYQIYNTIKEVERTVLEKVISKTQGNPLFAISVLHSMIQNNFVYINQQMLTSQTRLKYCLQTDCWNNFPLPTFISKQNFSILEQTLMGNYFISKLPSKTAVIVMILLKSAAVIGNVFSLKQLRQTCNLEDAQMQQIDIQLEELENRDIIELLFEDGYGDKIYRFTQNFMRETLYNLQVYDTQRKTVHTKFIHYLQENIIYNWQTHWNFDKEKVLLMQNLLEQHQLTSENQLTYTQKQPLIIKVVNTATFLGLPTIKQAQMSQQKKKKNNDALGKGRQNSLSKKDSIVQQKFYQAVYVTLTETSLSVYKDRLTYEYKQDANITLKLEDVIRVQLYKYLPGADGQQNQQSLSIYSAGASIPLEANDSFSSVLNPSESTTSLAGNKKQRQVILFISCREYTKGKEVKEKNREFVFIVDSRREAEEWMGSIEYLRTKASVKMFIEKFGGNVKLQLGDDFQPVLSQHQVHAKTNRKFGETLQRQILNSSHAQNLFQIRLYENLIELSNSKRVKKRLKEKLMTIHAREGEEDPTDFIYMLKDHMGALYNVLQLNLFHHMINTSCKYDQEQDCDAEPQSLAQYHQDLHFAKDQVIDPLKSQLFPKDTILDENQTSAVSPNAFAHLLDQTGLDGHEMTQIKGSQAQLMHSEHNQEVGHEEADEEGHEEHEAAHSSQLDENEEDDVMDDEEYKKMLERRNRKATAVRFSILERPKGAPRRMTVFNPIDPNNSMGFKFLVKDPSKVVIEKSQKTKSIVSENQSEIIDESMIQQSLIIADQPQQELFDEEQKILIPKVQLPTLKYTPPIEGADVFQVVSMLNDINMKQLNLKRRFVSNQTDENGHLVITQERNSAHKQPQNWRESIGSQQQRGRSPQREQKVAALSKILEQGCNKKKEHEGHKKGSGKKKKVEVVHMGTSESEVSHEDEDEVYQQIRKQNSQSSKRLQMMMSSSQSIAYLQTLQEAEKNSYGNLRRNSSSLRSTLSKRNFKGKVYKPTPSKKKLPEWEHAKSGASNPALLIYDHDDYIQEDGGYSDEDYGQESLQSKHSSVHEQRQNVNKLYQQLDPPSSNEEDDHIQEHDNNGLLYHPGDEVMLINKDLQCIVQGSTSQKIKLNKGDIVQVEVDLPSLNLIQCKAWFRDKFVSVVMPRDQVTKDFDSVEPDEEDSEEEEQKSPHSNKKQNQVSPRKEFSTVSKGSIGTQQNNISRIRGSEHNSAYMTPAPRSTSNPQNPSPVNPQLNSALTSNITESVRKGIFLKVQGRREKKLKEMQESPQIRQSQFNSSNQQHLLKVMERKMNKMMREQESPDYR